MTPRTAALVAVLAAAGIAVSGCGGGGNPNAAPQSPTLPTASSLNSPRPAVSVAPSNAPSAGASATSAAGATGDDKGGASGGKGSDDSALPTPNGNSGLGSLPPGFPLPEGTTLGRIAVRSSDITAPLEVPDGDRAAAFWKTQLPAAGYKFLGSTVSKAFGEIKFTGKGCIAGSDITVSGEHVAFLCRRA
ncbi:MAG TPA: hypothetical protein VGP36_11015 [Mycobacteriales bacterium]|jgi:hypothetical protein|nr:hypothetical protein [Mycobacteriales bacterium]